MPRSAFSRPCCWRRRRSATLGSGALADRWGHKQVLELATAIGLLALLLAVLAPSAAWFFPIFVLVGTAQAGYQLSGYTMIFSFSTPADRPTYIGVANTALAPMAAFGPLLAGCAGRARRLQRAVPGAAGDWAGRRAGAALARAHARAPWCCGAGRTSLLNIIYNPHPHGIIKSSHYMKQQQQRLCLFARMPSLLSRFHALLLRGRVVFVE